MTICKYEYANLVFLIKSGLHTLFTAHMYYFGDILYYIVLEIAHFCIILTTQASQKGLRSLCSAPICYCCCCCLTSLPGRLSFELRTIRLLFDHLISRWVEGKILPLKFLAYQTVFFSKWNQKACVFLLLTAGKVFNLFFSIFSDALPLQNISASWLAHWSCIGTAHGNFSLRTSIQKTF